MLARSAATDAQLSPKRPHPTDDSSGYFVKPPLAKLQKCEDEAQGNVEFALATHRGMGRAIRPHPPPPANLSNLPGVDPRGRWEDVEPGPKGACGPA